MTFLSLLPRSENQSVQNGKDIQTEPDDCILVDASDSLRSSLLQIGWLNFIKKFHGYNTEVSRQFVATFDGHKAIIGNLELPIT